LGKFKVFSGNQIGINQREIAENVWKFSEFIVDFKLQFSHRNGSLLRRKVFLFDIRGFISLEVCGFRIFFGECEYKIIGNLP
jgi:hypothetical protein